MPLKIHFLTESRADWGGIEPVYLEAKRRGHWCEISAPCADWSPPGGKFRALLDDPAWVVLLGDRPRVLHQAIKYYIAGVGIAHLSGGDKQTGAHVDEPTRHALSKFAHVHFPVSKTSAQRLHRHGEAMERIFMVGSTMVDALRGWTPNEPPAFMEARRSAGSGKYLVLIHPSVGWQDFYRHVFERFGQENCVCLQPCSDHGYGPPPVDVKFHANLPRAEFLDCLYSCRAFLGNSSSMVLEAQYLGVPCSQIGTRNGTRNGGREEAFPGELRSWPEIGVDMRMPGGLREDWQNGTHGDGTASQKIMDTLEEIGVPTADFLNKQWE